MAYLDFDPQLRGTLKKKIKHIFFSLEIFCMCLEKEQTKSKFRTYIKRNFQNIFYLISEENFFFPSHPLFEEAQLPNKKSDIIVNTINFLVFIINLSA